ncbi:MAG TPA: DUF2768 domain-containing protein [Bacillota bacterium]|nr:DUF2768 domain-containing protein [Bacillota bacterium]
MSTSMLKMYISFAGMIFLIIAIGLIMLSRYKLKGFFAGIVSLLAYICLVLGALIILYIVFTGPTG